MILANNRWLFWTVSLKYATTLFVVDPYGLRISLRRWGLHITKQYQFWTIRLGFLEVTLSTGWGEGGG